MKRDGIIAGGNWIVDHIKLIDTYPGEERLSNIEKEIKSSGGAPFNVLMALHKMGVDLPLEGIGVLGDDANGRSILEKCKSISIDTSQIRYIKDVPTSYTDVMTVRSTGKRTFFHCRGANAHLNDSHFDFSMTQSRIFHLGYLLLLDQLDAVGGDGLSGAAKVLRKAKRAGLFTTVDVVSEQSDRYRKIIPSAFPYVDLLFINEFELEMLTGMKILDGQGYLDWKNSVRAAEMVFEMGVKEWIVIHFSKGAFAVHRSERTIFQMGIEVPAGFIKGTVGAGDAFAAGVLAEIHDGQDMKEALICGISVAVSSLQDVTSTDGIGSKEKCLELALSLGLEY